MKNLRASRVMLGVSLVLALRLVAACERGDESAQLSPPEPGQVPVELVAHTAEFERRVYRVTDGVYQAVGFGIANSILVEGEQCVFIVDVLGSVESAAAVRAEFEKITPKPIEALIYTHNHGDHIFGGRGFVPAGEVDVYAHETTEFYIDRVVSIIRPILSARSARMFGNLLPGGGEDAFVNAGIGPYLEVGRPGHTLGLIRPNKTFAERLQLEICGVEVTLVHAPGETPDQLFVWLPQKGVLMPGDNVYKAFPNLYTIRGTLYRDVLAWVKSLDQMRALRPEHLAPSHTRPVSGRQPILEILTSYRDAIQYVHDQTIRGMNRGLTPDELVEEIELPAHLASHPYLRELYGPVAWSVRSIFAGYLGWFDGDSASLSPASPDERALGFAELAGGREGLRSAVERALEEGRPAWAAELAAQLLRLDPDDDEARRLKAAALRALGQRALSPNGRNFYLTQARELEGSAAVEDEPGVDESIRSVLETIPIGNFMAAMPVRLNPSRSAEVDVVVGFYFRDVDEGYTIHVRRGVAELQAIFPESPDITIRSDTTVWRELAAGLRNPVLSLASGEIEVEGSTLDLIGFLRLFSG